MKEARRIVASKAGFMVLHVQGSIKVVDVKV